MPVTKQSAVAYVLVGLNIDMAAGEGRALVRRFIDGAPSGDQEFLVGGTEFGALLVTPGVAGVTLGDQVTNAVYDYLVGAGLLSGVVS